MRIGAFSAAGPLFPQCQTLAIDWGMNPRVRWYDMAVNGDEPERNPAATRVFRGKFLFSTGPNTQSGLKRSTRGNYDAPLRDCSVSLDNQAIIEWGKLVVFKMIVPLKLADYIEGQ
jgi:2,5-dihydroxypyridine 5,6-dioxygenase